MFSSYDSGLGKVNFGTFRYMFSSYDSGLGKMHFGTLGIYFRLMTVDWVK
jgi:hypothetical protein